MESFSLIGVVRVVIGGIAVADSQNPATARELKGNAFIRIGNHAALVVQNGNRHDHRIFSVGVKRCPIRL